MTAIAMPERRSAARPAPAAPVSSDRLWTEEDVAAYLQVSPRSVRRMRIPRVMLPGLGERRIRRYDPVEVRAFVEGQKTARPRDARQEAKLG